MRIRIRLFITINILLIGLLLPGSPEGLGNESDSDSGFLFLGPRKVFKSKAIKKRYTLEAFTQEGMAHSNNATSPWSEASLFVHGSIFRDADGTILKEVAILDAVDGEGNICWGALWRPEGENGFGTIELIQGLGAYAGINGHGDYRPDSQARLDGYSKSRFNLAWNIDPENPPFSKEVEDADSYEFMDKSLSFHGPHEFLFSKEFPNGISLEFSTQSGVLMSRISPEMVSPRNNATCFDRGNTVKRDGKTLGDIMLLEDTDADGDIAWLYHIWWYNKGPGIYDFIGGTGKWESIKGRGVTKGMYKKRADDHYMLNSELYWNLER